MDGTKALHALTVLGASCVGHSAMINEMQAVHKHTSVATHDRQNLLVAEKKQCMHAYIHTCMCIYILDLCR